MWSINIECIKRILDFDDKYWFWELVLVVVVKLWLEWVDWLEDEFWFCKWKFKDFVFWWSWGEEFIFKFKFFEKDLEICWLFEF